MIPSLESIPHYLRARHRSCREESDGYIMFTKIMIEGIFKRNILMKMAMESILEYMKIVEIVYFMNNKKEEGLCTEIRRL